MPLIQIRDVPGHIYRLLAEQAERERRSLAQQAVAVLARGLQVEVDAKARRRALLEAIQSSPPARTNKLGHPAKLIREDRRR
jgi:gamma-glutamyl-gamma-aminobutyrate hydrolase PuuD